MKQKHMSELTDWGVNAVKMVLSNADLFRSMSDDDLRQAVQEALKTKGADIDAFIDSTLETGFNTALSLSAGMFAKFDVVSGAKAASLLKAMMTAPTEGKE